MDVDKTGDETTGKKNMEPLLDCLHQNGFAFQDIQNSREIDGYMVAKFSKDIQYTDAKGNWIGDRELIVSIEFDSDFDYKNHYRDKEGDFVYDGKKGKAFINKLSNKTYEKRDSSGGKRNVSRRRQSGRS